MYKRIENFLKSQNCIKNSDGSYDVPGDIEIPDFLIVKQKLAVTFRRVEGSFKLEDLELASLAGAPQYVGGHFIVRKNELKTLNGAPKYVGASFQCQYNILKSLAGVLLK